MSKKFWLISYSTIGKQQIKVIAYWPKKSLPLLSSEFLLKWIKTSWTYSINDSAFRHYIFRKYLSSACVPSILLDYLWENPITLENIISPLDISYNIKGYLIGFLHLFFNIYFYILFSTFILMSLSFSL